MAYFYIVGTVFFTVYGQLVMKWRMNQKTSLPEGISEKVLYLLKTLAADPFLVSGLLAAFIASLFWMAAMTKFSISFAYPFMSIAFVFVMLGSAMFLGESLNYAKVIGTLLIISGLVVMSRGY